jgi:hypothetical protein
VGSVPHGTWGYRIDLGAVPGGGRNQKQVAGFRSREEAEAALVEALAAYGGGDRRTVAGYLELVWLPAKAGAIERSRFDQYAWAVRRHVLPALGPVRLADLEPRVLERWLRQLASAAGTYVGGRCRPRPCGWSARCCQRRARRRSSGGCWPTIR